MHVTFKRMKFTDLELAQLPIDFHYEGFSSQQFSVPSLGQENESKFLSGEITHTLQMHQSWF